MALFVQLSRELKAQSIPGQTHLDLFSEFGSIFISESSSPPSERLADLILLCGGSVSKGQRQADLCVGRATLREEVTMVQEKWVLGEYESENLFILSKYNMIKIDSADSKKRPLIKIHIM